MKKILEFYDHIESSCSFWRGRGVLAELERGGYIALTMGEYTRKWSDMRRHDIAFFQRPMTKTCFPHIAMCKDMGMKVWIDLDDWYDIPKDHPVYEAYARLVSEDDFKKGLMLADVITVTNENIKEAYVNLVPRIKEVVKVVPNALNDYVYELNDRSDKKIMLWRGGSHHGYDIEPYVEQFKAVLSANKDWTLLSIGSNIKELRRLKNYGHIEGDFNNHNYMAVIKSLAPGVVVVPLVDNIFNRCKSSIAWVEATYVGGVAVMPEWSSNVNAITYVDNFDIILNTVLNNKAVRDRNYNRSIQILKDHFLLSKVNKQRLDICDTM